MIDLNEIANVIHQGILKKGFKEKTFTEALLLIVSEVSEATEEYRNGKGINETYYNPEKPTKPEGIPSELIDIVIRVFDLCAEYDIDIDSMIQEKMAYNESRTFRHGGKLI